MDIRNMIKAGGVAAALVAGAAMTTGAAHAVAVTGGTTAVTVTADLAGLGLTPGLEGSATAEVNDGLLTVFFPITGGSTGPAGNAVYEHDGSGVSLTAADGTTASVGNFVIKTSAGTVFGDLFGATTGSPLPFFNFGDATDLPGVELEISSTLAGALTGVFGAPDLTGATFGYAVPSPTLAPVPLPAGALLLIGGLGMLGLVRRRAAKA